MQSVFYLEWFLAKEELRCGNMNNILKYINEQVQPSGHFLPDNKTPKSKLQVRMDAFGKKHPNNPAVRDYYKFIGGLAETIKSIVIIVNAKFKLLELPSLKRIFEKDDLNLREYAYGVGGTREHVTDKKKILFLCSDDTDPSLNFVFSMIYTQAINILCRIADNEFRENKGALPRL